MISCSSDEGGHILTISYSRHVATREMEGCLEEIREQMNHLQPGFALLSDLTNLESMDAECAEPIGAIMDLLSSRGLAVTVRVIPDPTKDIGFNLISQFHGESVRTHTRPNLAEAMKCLLVELPAHSEAS